MPEPQADGDIGGEDETGENSGETEENRDNV
jgi:hypothetical protein